MDYDTWAITLLVFRRTRLASFQLNRKDVASISSRVLRENFEKLGREQKEEFGEGVERKEGGACFKEIKVNFANVDKRRFSNKPNREISRGVLQNRGVCGLAFPLLPFPPLFFFFLFFLLFSVMWYETVGLFGVHERISYRDRQNAGSCMGSGRIVAVTVGNSCMGTYIVPLLPNNLKL